MGTPFILLFPERKLSWELTAKQLKTGGSRVLSLNYRLNSSRSRKVNGIKLAFMHFATRIDKNAIAFSLYLAKNHPAQ